MAIRPLTVSDSCQTAAVSAVADRKMIRICPRENHFQLPGPKRNSAHRAPYSPQPSTVAAAKRISAKSTAPAAQFPRMAENAWLVSAAPASCPYGTGTPLTRIASAVRVQITMVSRKTSTIPIIPCSAGWATSALAWAMDAVPIPASLVKTPRLQPIRSARNAEPTIPPVTAFGENAPFTMEANAPGTASRRQSNTAAHIPMYKIAAKGTSSCAV